MKTLANLNQIVLKSLKNAVITTKDNWIYIRAEDIEKPNDKEEKDILEK